MAGSAPILLFVYSLCNGIGSPLLALQWAVDSYNNTKDDEQDAAIIVQTYIFETSTSANQVNDALLRRSNYPGEVHHMGDIKEFSRHASNLVLLIPPGRSYRVLVLSGTPCKSISAACRRSIHRKLYGIHANPSNVFWLAHAGLVRLQSDHHSWLWSFAENVMPGSQIDLSILDAHLGHRHAMCVPCQAGAPRRRYIWTNVPTTVPTYACNELYPEFRLPSGWHLGTGFTSLPCVRAIFPFLIWKYANQDPELSSQDRRVVDNCLLWHSQTNRWRLPTMMIWAGAMGLDETIMTTIMTVFPCLGTVRRFCPVTCTEDCGIWAYCDNCCQILTMIGEGWHLYIASHHVFHAFSQFMHFASDHLLYDKYFLFTQPIHECSQHCPAARRSL